MGKKANVVYERPQLIPTDNQAFGHHPKKYGKKRLTKAFRVAGKEKKHLVIKQKSVSQYEKSEVNITFH